MRYHPTPGGERTTRLTTNEDEDDDQNDYDESLTPAKATESDPRCNPSPGPGK